jgi:hypothetical protein
MTLFPHTVLGAAAGGVAWATGGSPWSVLIGTAAGVLPDADHLLDFYNWYIRGNRKKWLLLFHGWEYLVLMVIAYFAIGTPSWLLAVILGYATQIGADQIANPSYWHTYSITSRMMKKFNREAITPNHPDVGYEALVRSIPFGKERVRKWFANRVEATQD